MNVNFIPSFKLHFNFKKHSIKKFLQKLFVEIKKLLFDENIQLQYFNFILLPQKKFYLVNFHMNIILI